MELKQKTDYLFFNIISIFKPFVSYTVIGKTENIIIELCTVCEEGKGGCVCEGGEGGLCV